MRRLPLAAALLLATATTPGHAAGDHTLSARCAAPWFLAQPVVAGYAVASGPHRAISTEVVCSIDPNDCCPGTTVRQSLPGPFAAVAGPSDEVPGLVQPDVCVEARGFWSDGYSFTTTRVCGVQTVSVEETR